MAGVHLRQLYQLCHDHELELIQQLSKQLSAQDRCAREG